MKTILPIRYPTITSYPGRAYLYAVAEGNDKIYPWLMENFIQTESYLNKNDKYCDIDFLNIPQIRYSSNTALEAQNAFCQYIENMSIYAEIIGYGNVVDFMRNGIAEGYYIVIDINTQYIKAYKDMPHLHNMLVYGCDDDKSIFYIADFFSGMYEYSICSYEDLGKAALYFNELRSPFYPKGKGLISLFRIDGNCRHEFDIEKFRKALTNYLNYEKEYKAVFRNTNYFNSGENDMRSFGNLHFDNLIKFLEWCKSDNKVYVSRWAFSVFYDHKKAINQRLEFLNKTCIGCEKEIVDYRSVVNEAQLVRNLYLKCLTRKNVQVQNFDKLICKIRRIKEDEERILERLAEKI